MIKDLNELIDLLDSAYDSDRALTSCEFHDIKQALRASQEGDGWVTERELIYTPKTNGTIHTTTEALRNAFKTGKNVRVLIQYEDEQIAENAKCSEDAPEVGLRAGIDFVTCALQAFAQGEKLQNPKSKSRWFQYRNNSIRDEHGNTVPMSSLIHLSQIGVWQPYEQPKTKPSINGKWSDFLPDEYDWIAVDNSGSAYVYKNKPTHGESYWDVPEAESGVRIDEFPWFNRGDCPWDESLICRDETE